MSKDYNSITLVGEVLSIFSSEHNDTTAFINLLVNTLEVEVGIDNKHLRLIIENHLEIGGRILVDGELAAGGFVIANNIKFLSKGQ